MVIGLVVVVVGIVALLDALTVNIPWGVVLPAAIVLIGLILLLNPRSAAAGGWITVGAIMTVVLLVGSFADGPLITGPVDNVEQADFDVAEPVERIVVKVDAGTIEILGGAGETVEVERRLNFNDERPRVDHTVVDGVLEIEADCPGGFFSFGQSCFVDHVLRVPASVAVEIDTGSGSVTARELEGSVLIDTGSGTIELVDVSGRVTADSGSGGIVLDGVTGEALVRTGSGGIRGHALRSLRLVGETGSGSIDVGFVTAPDDLDLQAGSGSVTVTVPVGSYRLDLDTGSGSIELVDVGDDPGSPRSIRVRTGSGSVQVNGR